MGGTDGLVRGLEMREALAACARVGHARVGSALSTDVLGSLRAEIDAGPFRPFGESFGPVRQQIDGYDVRVPAMGFPLLTGLCRELRAVVRSQGRGVRGLATWDPNEVGIGALRAGLDRHHTAHGREVVPADRDRRDGVRKRAVLDLRFARSGRRPRAMDHGTGRHRPDAWTRPRGGSRRPSVPSRRGSSHRGASVPGYPHVPATTLPILSNRIGFSSAPHLYRAC